MEVIHHPGASAIVPMLTDGRVILIRQFRHAVGGMILEVPAGKLDASEDPEVCASRELEEETGYRARTLERLTTIVTTPGFTDERIHLFIGRDLEPSTQRLDPDEVLDVVKMPLEEAVGKILSGEIIDAKSICALTVAYIMQRDRDV
jgi:ADP-ribose pyrophosphatase